MIVKEVKVINNTIFYYYYSDQNMKIKDIDGSYYNSAYCLQETDFVETDEPIEEREINESVS